jgi:hypothetical protein
MPQRDSWTSALAPRLPPKARGSIPRELKAAGVSAGPADYRRARLSALAGGGAFGSVAKLMEQHGETKLKLDTCAILDLLFHEAFGQVL